MNKTNFEEVRTGILDLVRGSSRKGQIFSYVTGWVVRQTAPVTDEVYAGAYSCSLMPKLLDAQKQSTEGVNDTIASVYTTDSSQEPPITRVLVPTPFGRYVGIFEGEIDRIIAEGNMSLHRAESAIGHEVISAIQSQMAGAPETCHV